MLYIMTNLIKLIKHTITDILVIQEEMATLDDDIRPLWRKGEWHVRRMDAVFFWTVSWNTGNTGLKPIPSLSPDSSAHCVVFRPHEEIKWHDIWVEYTLTKPPRAWSQVPNRKYKNGKHIKSVNLIWPVLLHYYKQNTF